MDRTDVLIPNDVRQIGYRCTHHFWEYNGLFQSSKFKSWAHKYLADNVHLHKETFISIRVAFCLEGANDRNDKICIWRMS